MCSIIIIIQSAALAFLCLSRAPKKNLRKEKKEGRKEREKKVFARIECSVLLLLAIAVSSAWAPVSNKASSLWGCHGGAGHCDSCGLSSGYRQEPASAVFVLAPPQSSANPGGHNHCSYGVLGVRFPS